MGLIDRETINDLEVAECATNGFFGKSGEIMSTMEAFRLGKIKEEYAVRLLQVQVQYETIYKLSL